MKSVFISADSYGNVGWESFILSAGKAASFKIDGEIDLASSVFLFCEASLGGLQVKTEAEGLLLTLSELPGMIDWQMLNALCEKALKEGFPLKDSAQKSIAVVFSEDDLRKFYKEAFTKARSSSSIILNRGKRQVDVISIISKLNDLSDEKLEVKLSQKLLSLHSAKEPECFDIDGHQTVIWSGESEIWFPSDVEQLLFSKATFANRLCGSIAIIELKIALEGFVWQTENGILLPKKSSLSSSNYQALAVHMEHFEQDTKEKKPQVKLEIKSRDLERVSYEISGVLFKDKSLSKVNELLVQDGFSEMQLEVAALAVSGLFELVTTKKGQSIGDMSKALQRSHKLTESAAQAVVSGFIRAGQEAKMSRTFNKKALFLWSALITIVVIVLAKYVIGR
ncbi:MAG: hypothetical protein HRT88_08395 [Lentisphaeraceae bacterium]|nr:hypothetical protein [Lentisphaeraceae bacterium]